MRWYGPAGSAFCCYVVRLYSWYNSYRMVTEARSPSLKADNLNHVAVDSLVEHNPASDWGKKLWMAHWRSGPQRWKQLISSAQERRHEVLIGGDSCAPQNLISLRTLATRVVLDSNFRADSTLTHVIIQVTQLSTSLFLINSTPTQFKFQIC